MDYQLSRADVAQVVAIVDECSELWGDAEAWQRHAATRVESLIGGVRASLALGELSSESCHRILEYHSSSSDDGLDEVAAYLKTSTAEILPGYMNRLRKFREQGLGVITGAELSSSDEYYGSFFFQTYLRPRGIDELLMVEAVAEHAGLDVQFAISRENKARRFSTRERNILCAVAESLAARVEVKLSTHRQCGRHYLSSRQNHVLAALLNGDSEKQIAALLEISVPTVHEHVTSLYRYFKVHSRGELFAYFLRQRPTLRPTSSR